MKVVLTGSYENCKDGNIISISKDEGKKANYDGLVLSKLKPNKDFLDDWEKSSLINMNDYIKDYYYEILSKIDPQELFDSLPENPILLDYSDNVYRHLVAFWLELFLEIKSYEVEVNTKRDTLRKLNRPDYLKVILEKIIKDSYNMNGYESISAAYLYNKSKEKEEEYKLTLTKKE